MDTHAIVGLWYIAKAIADPQVSKRAEAYARRVLAKHYRPAGYIDHGSGFDPSYNGISFYFLTWAAMASDWDFIVPDLKGRAALHAGTGPGLSPRRLGQKGGVETVNLAEAELPAHSHPLLGHNAVSTSQAPAGNSLANTPSGGRGGGGVTPYGGAANLVSMAGGTTPTGGSQAHDNVQPRIAVNYIIALDGIFPSRN